LFVGAVEQFIGEKMEILHNFEPLPEDVEEGLCAFGRKLLDLALRPETLAFLRLFIAEAPRFPDLAKLFVTNVRHRGHAEIIRVLAAYDDSNAIELGDPEIRAEQFFILVVGLRPRGARGGRPETQSFCSPVSGWVPEALKQRMPEPARFPIGKLSSALGIFARSVQTPANGGAASKTMQAVRRVLEAFARHGHGPRADQ
jgi:AefR-like transcriptional repressor, C-terminal domain